MALGYLTSSYHTEIHLAILISHLDCGLRTLFALRRHQFLKGLSPGQLLDHVLHILQIRLTVLWIALQPRVLTHYLAHLLVHLGNVLGSLLLHFAERIEDDLRFQGVE